MDMLTEGITKEEMAVMDTMITMAADTMPASTAAWPMTSVPTMDTAWPTVRGIRIPASRSTS
ncbi:hypothetical protein D3C81_1931880 [compost metagenome]